MRELLTGPERLRAEREDARDLAAAGLKKYTEVKAERDRFAEQVQRVEELRDRWEAAVRDPSTYHGGAEHAAALAASHLPDLRRALAGEEVPDVG